MRSTGRPSSPPLHPCVRSWWLRPTQEWLGRLLAQQQRAATDAQLGFGDADIEWLTEPGSPWSWVPLSRAERFEAALLALHGGDVDTVMSEAGVRIATSACPQIDAPEGNDGWSPFSFASFVFGEGAGASITLRISARQKLAATTEWTIAGYLGRRFGGRCEPSGQEGSNRRFVLRGPFAGLREQPRIVATGR